MTKKEFLRQHRRASAILNSALGELEAAYHAATGIRAMVVDDMPKGHDTERDLSDSMVVIEERAAKLNAVKTECVRTMEQVEAAIRTAPTDMEFNVLWMRYVECRRWDDIAEKLHVSRQWVTSIHGRALEHIKIGGESVL